MDKKDSKSIVMTLMVVSPINKVLYHEKIVGYYLPRNEEKIRTFLGSDSADNGATDYTDHGDNRSRDSPNRVLNAIVSPKVIEMEKNMEESEDVQVEKGETKVLQLLPNKKEVEELRNKETQRF